jgi:hypothetical protein
MRLFKWLVAGRPPENLSEIIEAAPTMRTDHLSADAWELEPDNVIELRKKLAAGGPSLAEFVDGKVFRGVTTGLNEVFVVTQSIRNELIAADERSNEIIKPFVQGTHLRPWYIEASGEFLIFPRRGICIDEYPAVLEYLESHRERLEPKPSNWPSSKKWKGRKPGSYKWYEIQDSVDYWPNFERPKIVWPDISKLPRFSMDTENRYLGNTGYIVPGGDYFLLGVLSSSATWFYISKTAQPLRLRGNRWQYRLIAQFMEKVPIPSATDEDKQTIGNLAQRACSLGRQRYELQTSVQHRLRTTFGESASGEPLGKLNAKAHAWWEITANQLGGALKTSFKLASNPMSNPRTADEWEPYLAEKRGQVERLTRELADAESEINERVYRLFNLTDDEIALLQREVEH